MEILTNEELLKEKLTPVREVCPMLLDIFTWRQDMYPGILGAVVTFFFGMLWYLNPSVLTTLSFVGLIITGTDFLFPLLAKSVTSADDWSEEKERKFSILVNRIAYYSVQIWNTHVTLDEWKREKPNIYSACVVISLLFLAWIGNAINNLLLAYFFVLFMALLPGLLHRRILQSYLSKATLQVATLLGIKTKKT